MNELTAKKITEFINRYDNFLIASHQQPDSDAIYSTLTLASLLERKGKNYFCYNEGPFTPSTIKEQQPLFISTPQEIPTKDFALIIVDCNEIQRVGNIAKIDWIKEIPTLIIDHHIVEQNKSKENLIVFIDSNSPSTTLLIKEIADILELPLTSKEANQLLFGFSTDSGFFRYINPNQHNYLHTVAKLIESGGNLKECYNKITGGKTLEQKKFFSLLINRVTLYYNDSIAITYENCDDFSYFSPEAKDADLLYSQLFSINSIEAIFYLKQKEENCYVIGFRSRDKINVGKMATHFGGGGHRLASGATVNATKDSIVQKILTLLKENNFYSD